MHKFFTEPNNITEAEGRVLGDDVKHIYKVLRLSEGEEVVLNNCEGIEYLGKIASITKSEVIVNIIKKLDINNESKVKVHLFQGLPKGQKMDLIVQKGTELGIVEFIPTLTARVDVKLKGEFKKLDRLNRIALEASKQSKRSIVPQVKEVIEFKEALDRLKEMDLVLVPYENAEDFGIKSLIRNLEKENADLSNIKNVGILIGPEGGFEEEEIDTLKKQGAYIVTLGNRILRTETAGFTATALIQYELGDLGGKLL
ncbi:16S rRNA (uracil1498-N3)-methyltransferase [Clostridium saccharoperbutylacetonicum]|uniref:Ribosomal RNA small subunit methyltransferase E n=1 Tax=Clostridium saccharoperbutylacetonicum N1-4(HMT) TaxID=931276 RepID=M1M9R8_9CLOT|nr:RsmE family RNA methyltransferase [Clostridium saccharoperbutylacetonicum]AGF54699.1 ribosomal RNA small subunit methyltransferase E [Clostridium saccharoperbutylacetonicum N1-4(HMT)]NRT58780.1 16S rRNA (uracil1498-N3)-methyltransferase [Clostridium saccharoperbutylacetonicum]NSB27969.1 16S rRNA (uracil1498-N3)-methyltransferase [Clostridium saccharoperbutylacetonicum]NSB41452.1 16S rRNA (uracil1498-N3)-methyltransferase [Clostridium saccharoperbutylacetonicum]